MYSPDWIFSPYGDPSFYTASSVSMFFDLLSIVIAVSDISLAVISLRFHWKKSAQRSAGSGSEVTPSSHILGDRRTSGDRSELLGEIKEYALKHSVFRKKE